MATLATVARALARTGLNAVRGPWTQLNELALNIKTVPARGAVKPSPGSARPWWRGELSDRAKHDDNAAYAAPDYWYIRKIIRSLALASEDVFYDVGSGMGRILCIAARNRVRKCVGIELFQDFCAVAQKNAQRLRGRRAPVELLCEDAARACLSGGTIYYLFNPFGSDTMRDFLANLKLSLESEPRTVVIVYHNCVHRSILDSCNWLAPVREFRTLSGLCVAFWRTVRTS